MNTCVTAPTTTNSCVKGHINIDNINAHTIALANAGSDFEWTHNNDNNDKSKNICLTGLQ
ncbi:MAG: hypothetical protein ACK5ME_05760 [Parahaliea sp.]